MARKRKPNPVPIAEDEQKKILARAQKEIKINLERKSKLDQEIAKWHNAYEGETTPKNFPHKKASNLRSSIIPIAVDALTAALYLSLTAYEPLVVIEGWGSEEDRKKAKKREKILDYFNVKETDTREHIHKMIRGICIEGQRIWKVIWERQTRKVFFETEKGRMMEDEEIINGPRILGINLTDFVADWVDDNIQRCTFCAHRVRLQQWELEERRDQGIYVNVDEVLKGTKAPEPTPYQSEMDKAQGLVNTETVYNPVYETWEYWTWWRPPGTSERRLWVFNLSLDKNIILKARPTPFAREQFPFFVFDIFPRDKQGISQGIAKKLWHLAKEDETLRNQRIDSITAASISWFTVLKSLVLPPDTEVYPGKMIPVDDHGQIRERQFNPVTQASIFDTQQIYASAEKLSAMSDIQLGRTAEWNKDIPYRSLALLAAKGEEKINMFRRRLHKQLTDVMRWIEVLIGDFLPSNRAKMKRILDEDYVPGEKLYDRYDKYNYTLKGATEARNKYIEQRKWELIYNVMSNSPLVVNPLNPTDFTRLYYLTEQFLKSFGDMTDIENIIGTPQMWQLVSQQAQQRMELLRRQAEAGGITRTPERPPTEIPIEREGGLPAEAIR